MKSDIVVVGSHADIINKFKERKLYAPKGSSADIFFISALVGLYDSKISELDGKGDNKVEISRLFAVNNPDFVRLISTFENLEDKYNGIDLTLSDIFMDEERTNNSEKVQKIKDHAYYGLTKLDDIYFSEDNGVESELDVVLAIEKQIKSFKELDEMKVEKEPIKEKSFAEIVEEDFE